MRAILAILLTVALASAQFVPFPGPGRRPAAGGGPPAALEYISGVAADSGGGAATTIESPTFTYPAGSTVIAFAVADGTISGVTCNSQALTKLAPTHADGGYVLHAYVLYNANAGTNVTCTATWTASVSWRRIHAVAYTGLATASAYLQGDCAVTGCDAPASASTNRTTLNVTTSVADTAHIAYFQNYDSIGTYTAATNYILDSQIDNNVTSAVLSRTVSSTGTYPSGNVATANSDVYLGFYLVFELTS